MGTEWEDLAGWWMQEVADDPAYQEEVLPLLVDLLDPQRGNSYLDAGCGDGRVMRAVVAAGARAIGCDVNLELLRLARSAGPVVGCRLPGLDWIRPGVFDGAYGSLIAEHIADLSLFFGALAEAVRTGGSLVLVVNHPLFTAPESGPVVDPTDGEVFWRWGTYLQTGNTEEVAGQSRVMFHHRPLAILVNAAADAGWSLQRAVERGVSPTSGDTLLVSQGQIPRLLGVRWTRF